MAQAIREGFELVNCPMCGGADWSIAHAGRDWAMGGSQGVQVVRCKQCGLNFTNPRPDAEHLVRYYDAAYAPYLRQRGEIERKSWLSTVVRTWVLAAAYGAPQSKPRGLAAGVAGLVSFIKPAEHFGFGVPYHGRGRLLDFGCGNGTFLRRMKAIGWDPIGIDFSAEAVAAVKASGIQAIQGTLPHPSLEAGSFDVVTMRSSLEHVGDPRAILAAARDLLRPEGRLVIQVPNFHSWEIEYFGDAALSLDLPRHLIHFTPKTLAEMLAACGFGKIEIRQASRPGGLRKSLRQIGRREPRATDRWFAFKPVCAWMARRALRLGKGNELIAVCQR